MAVLGVLQPSGSMTITMREFWSGNSFVKTLDEIMEMGKARDSSCNTIFLNSYNDSYIYLVRLGHLNDPEDLYFANFNQNSIAWNPTSIGTNNTLYNITRNGDALEPAGVAWNPSHTTWEGVSYDAYSEGSSERPLIIYTTANYENLYINGVLVDKNTGGGAGSGYIGNSLLSNKKMVGYNVPTSSAESTYTESVNEASETPVANKPKIGNGFARIKLLRATSDISFFTSSLSSDLMVEDWDIANVKDSLTYGNSTMQPTMYSEFFLTEWNFNIGNQWAPSTTISDGELVRTGRGDNRSDAVFWIPVNRINKTIIKITADYKVTDQRHWGSGFDRIGFWVGYVDSNNEWHSVSLGDKYPDDENWHTGGEWVYNGTLIPYIDYIGIEGGDGIYHAKNIILTLIDN